MGADFLPKRRLGGYRKEEVDQLLEDREAMIRHAESLVQSSEARVAQLEQELARLSANQVAPGERDMQAAALEAMTAEQARLDEEREALRGEREQLAVQLATVRQEGDTLAQDLERVRQEREDLEAELAALRDAATVRNDDAAGLRKEAEDARAEAASLREDMSRLETDAAAAQQAAARRDEEIERLGRDLDVLTADHEEQAAQIAAAREDASFFLQDEIQKVIATARESARLMLDRTKSDTTRQVAEADRWWREVQAEVGRFTSWRSQVEPMLQSLQEMVGDVRASIEDVAGRAHESVATMSTALQSLDAGMSLLSQAFEQKPPSSPLIAGPERSGRPAAPEVEPDNHAATDSGDVADESIGDGEAADTPTLPEYYSIQP